MENHKQDELCIESQRLIKTADVIIANRMAGDKIKSLASLSKVVFGHSNYFTTLRRQKTAPSPKMVDYLVDNYNISRDYIFKGIGGMFIGTDQPVSQGGSDVTPSEADLNNPRTMERLLEMLERRDTEFRELLRQNGELIEMLKQERGNRGTTYAQKKEA